MFWTAIMLSYEKYEKNIDTCDKYGIQNTKISKCVTYSGNLDLIQRKKCDNTPASTPPLAAAILGIKNTAVPLPDDLDFVNLWTDVDAQEAYLSIKPTSYLILGKPGLGSYTLGESFSKKMNCIHLSTRNVLLDEIENNSPTGRCLDFNMRHNKVCKFEHIIAIMQVKIQSSVIQHRGYVISGLPLVSSSKTEKYLFDCLHTEESISIVDDLLYDLIWNLKRKKAKTKVEKPPSHSSASSEDEKAEEEEVAEEQQPEVEPEKGEELPVEMPKYLLDLCSDIVTDCKIYLTSKKTALLQQIQEVFNFSPSVIVHISSPDTDTLTKKSRKYFNYINNSTTFNYFETNIDLELRWPNKYTMIDYSKPYDTHIFNPKYNCKQPINFANNSLNQICNYKTNISPFVEEKVKDFDTKFILKVDGRSSVHQMLHYIIGKLLLMPVKPVLIPKPLYLEEPPEDLDEFWNTVKQLNTIKNGVLNFNRYASAWYIRCPVELKKRKSIQGKPKFAVSLFKHVYLLSSLESMIAFCKNPRPYLKIEYLEPTCRIIVIGTKSSGKTMIAKCLSWLFDTPIICYKTFLRDEKEKKYNTYAKNILSEIIATIEDARFVKWQNTEIERKSNLSTWFNSVFSTLKKYVSLFIKYLKLINEEEEETDEEIIMPESEINQMEFLKQKISFLPILDDLDLCKETMLDTNLLKYAPIELITETIKPLLPVLGDKDVTEAISAYIVANDLQKDIEPTTEELMNELTQNLLTNDRESLNDKEKYGKFIIDGFPSDPEFWGYLDEFKLLPDCTIVITENKEIDIELLKAYLIIDKSSKCYKERYILSSDPLVQLKQQQMNSVDNPVEEIQSLTHELLNNICSVIFGDNDGGKESTEMVTSFTEAIDKFREEWDIVKLKLEENSKAVVLVEIETKSDVEVLDEVLLKLRQCYYLSCIPLEENELEDTDDEDNAPQDMLTYNDPYYLGETNLYCPVAYYDYGVLWEAKSEFCTQFQNKSYYFCKKECIDIFQRDVTKYQTVNEPFKSFPPLRICVIGSIGCGKTTLSKQLAKELGVMHIDFEEFVNSYLIPKHFKKVGRQYENSFKDMPIDDEAVIEFQADEENEKIADIIFNENEIRRMVYNYFEKGTPLLSFLVQKLLKILWSKEPYSSSGFILDGFPKLPSDVEDMTASFCVPDIVIDLQGSSEKALERLSSKMLKRWKMQLTEAKNEVKMKFEKMRKEWFDSITKEVVIKLITDEIINNAFPATSETDINPELNVPSVHSTIIDAHPSGSANVHANLFNYYNELIQDNPEPVDESQWEKAEDVLERINARLESIFEIDDENIQTLKDILSENKIKNVSADGTKSIMKVFRTVLPKLSVLRNRNESLFEQTFIITCDIAETLLMEGFYLFSKFNRMCPVFIFENLQALSNPYNMCKRINKTFPVIHRANIYFLSSANNLVKFRKNPLKYIQSDAINSFWEYPLRVGIIGPPKSGKSDLAAKLAKRYGLLCMSRGQSIRHVLEKFDWTEAAVKMNTTLQSGECIGTELIMNAVHTVTIDHRVVTNGFVLDGFPDSPAEATELVKLGLYPLIVIEINCNEDTVRKNSQNEIYYHLLKHKPPYSQPFIEYRNSKWQESCSGIKTWINDDTQNLYTICGNSSKWQCHHDAINLIEDIIRKVNYYLRNVKTKIVPAFVMGISNEIFEKRMSPFKNLCPICLRRNILRHNGFPIDKRGLVQFRNVLYWFCPDHFDLGLKHPELYLKGKVKLPEIPAPIKTISSALLYEDGVCIVTYADNLPSQKIYRGNPNFAASYHGNHYLFCSLKCLQKFLARPRLYYDVTVFKETAIFPTLSLKKLPNLGYLEQTLGNILTRACCAVNATRPKYPGLNIRVSGLLYVALYLKLHNPSIKEPVHDMYDKVYRKYEARCKLIHDIRYRLRSMENPFAKYPKRCSPRKVNTGTVSKPPSIVSMSNTVSSGSTYNRIDSYFP